jgi:outer membrane immunogenic protein
MKRIVAVGIASVGIAMLGITAALSPAVASDLPPPMAPPPPVVMLPAKAPGVLPFNWGGLYAGLNLGGGIGGDVTGVVFGGQVGYNWQINQLVFGVETDLQFSSQSDTSRLVVGATVLNDKQELDWFGTFRGRVGYVVFDRWLPYITAGLAYGTRKGSGTATGAVAGAYSSSDTSVGWAVGVGVDYAFNQWWSARLEYLHISLDSYTSPTFALTGGTLAVAYGRLNNDIIRGAVNYRIMP